MIFFDKKSKRREVRSVPHKNFLRTPLKFSAYSFKIPCAENLNLVRREFSLSYITDYQQVTEAYFPPFQTTKFNRQRA